MPWLHISVTEAPQGPNPIVELRRRYDVWRTENLPPCPGCRDLAIDVPPGGGAPPASRATAVGEPEPAPGPSIARPERVATAPAAPPTSDGREEFLALAAERITGPWTVWKVLLTLLVPASLTLLAVALWRRRRRRR